MSNSNTKSWIERALERQNPTIETVATAFATQQKPTRRTPAFANTPNAFQQRVAQAGVETRTPPAWGRTFA